MKAGDIVLAVIYEDDQKKIRPVVILKKLHKYNDALACGISSQLHQEIPGFDMILKNSHLSFGMSGLKKSSVIRLGFLAVIQSHRIIGTIGVLESSLHKKLLNNLVNYLLN